MESKKQLQVGDVVYSTAQWSSRLHKNTIERVTAKQAFFGHTRCKRELRNGYGDELCADVIGSYGRVTLQNERLESQYKLQQLRISVANLIDKVSKIRVDTKDTNDLEILKSRLNRILYEDGQLLNSVLNAPVSDTTEAPSNSTAD